METCENCKYSEPIMGGLACMGQKGMPYVRPTDSCDSWKTMKQTNADHLRQMSDKELAEWVTTVGRTFGEEYEGYMSALGWLKAPAEVDKCVNRIKRMIYKEGDDG